jgi:hypothetical protein
MGDPYAVLGIQRSATTEEVRAAFRRAALKFHPDRHVGEGAEAVSRASQQFNDVRCLFWQRFVVFFPSPPRRLLTHSACVSVYRLSAPTSGSPTPRGSAQARVAVAQGTGTLSGAEPRRTPPGGAMPAAHQAGSSSIPTPPGGAQTWRATRRQHKKVRLLVSRRCESHARLTHVRDAGRAGAAWGGRGMLARRMTGAMMAGCVHIL